MVTNMWEELYKQHYQELLRKAVCICRNSAQAEDAVQETFLRALQNVSVVEDLGPSQRRAWLFRALKNLLTDGFRRNTLEDQYTQELPPEAAIEQEPGFEDIENELFLSQLPPEEQLVFRLRFLEGYTGEEISEMLNLPAGTVRSRLSRSPKKAAKNAEIKCSVSAGLFVIQTEPKNKEEIHYEKSHYLQHLRYPQRHGGIPVRF